jgi:hypothetical protein
MRRLVFGAVFLACACQPSDSRLHQLEERVGALEGAQKVILEKVAEFENTKAMAGDAFKKALELEPTTCATVGIQSTQRIAPDFLVAELDVDAIARGSRVHGELINTTGLIHQNLIFKVTAWDGLDSSAAVQLSLLKTLPSGGSADFSIVIPDVQPSHVKLVCLEYQNSVIRYMKPRR